MSLKTRKNNESPDLTQTELIDRYNRHLNYLRISITDRCNLQCNYCVPRSDIPKLDHGDILSYEEILRVVRIGVGLGIKKVRVTGGEPLVRKGAVKFLKSLVDMEGIEDTSLTTNGVLLKKFANQIQSAGIRRINISLDTLDPEKYRRITGVDTQAPRRIPRGHRCHTSNGRSDLAERWRR